MLEEMLVDDAAHSAAEQSAAEQSAKGFSKTTELVKALVQQAENTMCRVDHGLNHSSLKQTFAQAKSLLRKARE
ncbi:MAG: hypothetical protein VW840_20900 [Gammaproteobacteria bacterium]